MKTLTITCALLFLVTLANAQDEVDSSNVGVSLSLEHEKAKEEIMAAPRKEGMAMDLETLKNEIIQLQLDALQKRMEQLETELKKTALEEKRLKQEKEELIKQIEALESRLKDPCDHPSALFSRLCVQQMTVPPRTVPPVASIPDLCKSNSNSWICRGRERLYPDLRPPSCLSCPPQSRLDQIGYPVEGLQVSAAG